MYTSEESTAGKIKSFTDLHAWKEAHKLVLLIYRITKDFPSHEAFGLTNQLRRAAVSITSNIAEGFSRRSSKEKVQFFTTSLSSLTETQNQMLIARDIDYLSQDLFSEFAAQSIIVSKLTNGIIKSARLLQYKEPILNT